MTHTNAHHGLSSNEIADALAKAATIGIARPEGVADRGTELLNRWNGDPSPRALVQVLNLEAALFWQEESETQRTKAAPRDVTMVRPKAVCRAKPVALSLVSANVLTLHPADEQPDTMIG